jgi:hypothetical protein
MIELEIYLLNILNQVVHLVQYHAIVMITSAKENVNVIHLMAALQWVIELI